MTATAKLWLEELHFIQIKRCCLNLLNKIEPIFDRHRSKLKPVFQITNHDNYNDITSFNTKPKKKYD